MSIWSPRGCLGATYLRLLEDLLPGLPPNSADSLELEKNDYTLHTQIHDNIAQYVKYSMSLHVVIKGA